jgi:two-component system, NarL family, nitrate/nitrite response regulator NarL
MSSPRVLIVEDHTILAESLALALRLTGFDEVELASPDLLEHDAVVEQVEAIKPEVVLLDLNLGRHGVSIPLIQRITELGPRVLVLTATEDPVMLGRCIEAGASGVFSKSKPFERLIPAVADAARGLSTMRPAERDALLDELSRYRADEGVTLSLLNDLTDREAAVLVAIIRGASAEQIAGAQFVAVSTVRSHIRSVLAKLGVNSQLAAVALARRVGWPGDGADA